MIFLQEWGFYLEVVWLWRISGEQSQIKILRMGDVFRTVNKTN